MKLGFIGAGQMARALAAGLSKGKATSDFFAFDIVTAFYAGVIIAGNDD